MEDEFYRDLLGDFDGKLLEIHLDEQNDNDDPQSFVIDVSLSVSTVVKRESPERQEDKHDETAWLRVVLSSCNVDAIVSELNSIKSHASERFDQLASIFDVSLEDIDFEPIVMVDPADFPLTPRGFGGCNLPSTIPALTPAPVPYRHQLTPWCTRAVLHHHPARRSRGQVLSPTIFMPLVLECSSSTTSNQCLAEECTQLAVILDMCHAHAAELFEHLQPPPKKARKRRRAVFSTGAKKKKKKVAKTPQKKYQTSVKPVKTATKKRQDQQQQHEQLLKDIGKQQQEDQKACVHKRPLRSRRNRRISYGEAA